MHVSSLNNGVFPRKVNVQIRGCKKKTVLFLPFNSTMYGGKSNAACSYHMLVLDILMNGLNFVKNVEQLEILLFFYKMTSHFPPTPEKKKRILRSTCRSMWNLRNISFCKMLFNTENVDI